MGRALLEEIKEVEERFGTIPSGSVRAFGPKVGSHASLAIKSVASSDKGKEVGPYMSSNLLANKSKDLGGGWSLIWL